MSFREIHINQLSSISVIANTKSQPQRSSFRSGIALHELHIDLLTVEIVYNTLHFTDPSSTSSPFNCWGGLNLLVGCSGLRHSSTISIKCELDLRRETTTFSSFYRICYHNEELVTRKWHQKWRLRKLKTNLIENLQLGNLRTYLHWRQSCSKCPAGYEALQFSRSFKRQCQAIKLFSVGVRSSRKSI